MVIYVLKFGTNALRKGSGVDKDVLGRIAGVVNYLYKKKNIGPVIVTSGAMLAGMEDNGGELPADVDERRYLAALGWDTLVGYYKDAFKKYGLMVPSEFLLTHHNFSMIEERENIKAAVDWFLKREIIPLINTNDILTPEELIAKYEGETFGDNDGLGSLVARATNAERMYLFTDVEGIYNKNPKEKDAKIIKTIPMGEIDSLIEMLKEDLKKYKKENGYGKKGIISKLEAGKSAGIYGIYTLVTHINNIEDVVIHNKKLGTEIIPN